MARNVRVVVAKLDGNMKVTTARIETKLADGSFSVSIKGLEGGYVLDQASRRSTPLHALLPIPTPTWYPIEGSGKCVNFGDYLNNGKGKKPAMDDGKYYMHLKTLRFRDWLIAIRQSEAMRYAIYVAAAMAVLGVLLSIFAIRELMLTHQDLLLRTAQLHRDLISLQGALNSTAPQTPFPMLDLGSTT